MDSAKNSYELLKETARYIYDNDEDTDTDTDTDTDKDTDKYTDTLGRCLPVEAAVLSLLALPLDPPEQVASYLRIELVGRKWFSGPYIRLPEIQQTYDPSRDRSRDEQAGIKVWMYSTVSEYHRLDTLIARDLEFLPGPEALRELACNDFHFKPDGRGSIEAISGSPDSTLLALTSLCDSETPPVWLATIAASNLSIGEATRFYSLDVYASLLGKSTNALAQIYSLAPADRFLYWARLLRATNEDTNDGALNVWSNGPAGPHLIWLYSLLRGSHGDPRNELKLIPLLQGVDPALVFLFALDVSDGPLLVHAARSLPMALTATYGKTYGPGPLRNLFRENVDDDPPARARTAALRYVIGLIGLEDLQAGLDGSIRYETRCREKWHKTEYFAETNFLILSWDLIRFALTENSGLTISAPPTDEGMLLEYLELSEPGPTKGRIRLDEDQAQDTAWLMHLYSLYRVIRDEPVVHKCLTIAAWHGFAPAAFMDFFFNDWQPHQIRDAVSRLLADR